jgi:hypothetical protein
MRYPFGTHLFNNLSNYVTFQDEAMGYDTDIFGGIYAWLFPGNSQN